MSRIQVSNDYGGERLQTQARPQAMTEQAAQPVDDGRWKALANVFAQGAGVADTVRQQAEEDERAAAKKWAQSMTVGELGKAIKEGRMLPSQSPVFVGTAQHIWGVNAHESGLRDMQSKLTTGELKFKSPEEADQYLTEWRNTTLAGQSKYAVAGFDKGYAGVRDKVMDVVKQQADKQWVENAQVQATDFLANSLNVVASKDYKGTAQEAASELMQKYQLMRHTKTLPDAAAKGALAEMVTRMAGSGNTAILGAFLDSEMEGIGSVRGFLGEAKAQTLTNHATTVFDGQQRQRIDDETLPFYQAADEGTLNVTKLREWGTSEGNKKYVSSATIHAIERANMAALARQQRDLQASQMAGAIEASQADAERKIAAAIAAGRLPDVMGTNKPQVLTKSGDLKDADVKDIAERAAVRMTANMPFDQQVGVFAQNGLENPNWKASINAAYFNLATIGVDSKGKPTGQLNEAGKQGVELFKKLSPYGDYAKSLMSEAQYNRFSDIAFLTTMGRSVDDAAGLAASAANGAVIGSDTDKLVKKVHAQVGEIQKDGFYKFDWAQRLLGDNTTANTVQMTSTLRRYSTLLAHSGQYGDAESAIKAAFTYIADPKVSAKVNGTIYLRSEMPTGPATHTQEEWFERYIEAVPKVRAKELGFKDSEVRLEFDPTIRAYRGFVGGLPMTNADNSLFVVRKDDIQSWYATQSDIDLTEAAAKGAANVKGKQDTQSAGAAVSAWAKANQEAHARGTAPESKPSAKKGTGLSIFDKPFREQPVIDMSGIGKPGQDFGKKAEGMTERGNIDLNARPVVKNKDGTISTVRSIGVNVGGVEVLIPTVSPDGKILNEQEAVALYKRTGKHLGKFATAEASTAYAESLHTDQDKLYTGRGR